MPEEAADRRAGLGPAVVDAARRLGRKAAEHDQGRPGQDGQADDQVGDLHGLGLAHEIGGGVEFFDTRQDEVLPHPQAGQRAQGIEGLGQVEAKGGMLFVAQDGHQGIGRGFQEGQARGDDEQGAQQPGILPDFRAGPEGEGAEGEDDEAGDHGRLVAEAPHQQAGGYRHDEVAGVKRLLHQAGFEVGEDEGLLELWDQDVVEIVGHAPEKEQGGDQYDRPQGRRRRLRRRRRNG